ncbi:ABC-F family ATP-binding cassette domain-containing protein [Tropicimonas sp. IMCC34011]|uniref:ABC-F family ATP-binding cassette domain-containing protein n=1 Tax=Tropicimonas sp. IMCC34011 TaxID=2248759 RepID=UPI000E230EDE|nr:ATP-binding cassette domain-containing protein [Tropicimonas sp. IMCC34011]
MAKAPLLQLSDVSLTWGGDPLFSGLDAVVQTGDRVALVGRNGSGKSTLMKVMSGVVEPDTGARTVPAGTTVARLEQEPDMAGCETLGDYAMAGLDPSEEWRVEAAAEGLDFDPDRPVATASGGERRRAALARLLAEDADLMLLDEPTNHLDIGAIRWLEDRLAETRAAFVLISHDRAFLSRLTRATLWLDRGQVRRQEAGFASFEEWREKTWAEEDEALHKLDRKIKAEARWAVEGISARRKRNQGRVRALQALREERAGAIRRQGTADLEIDSGRTSGKLVVDARNISKRFGDKDILRDFTIRVQRGDRLALVGPNGAGKTTLLNMLIGNEAPDSGTIRLGTNLELAVFDQTRAQLDPDATLWESLTGDPATRIAGKGDQVMVRGTPRNVVSYLKDFLFDESQARAPVRALSGGERARLLLARIMAHEANLLVLDEPTNDLDIETLDLLQDLLGEYDGTVLLVSHDRDFIDRIATQTVVMEGGGTATLYAGGWTDMLAQRPEGDAIFAAAASAPSPAPATKTKAEPAPAAKSGGSLSFTEKHRLEELPGEIERIEAEIAKLEQLLSDPQLFTKEPMKFRKATEALAARQDALSSAESEWLTLEEKAG